MTIPFDTRYHSVENMVEIHAMRHRNYVTKVYIELNDIPVCKAVTTEDCYREGRIGITLI